jgi:hypothetical protein
MDMLKTNISFNEYIKDINRHLKLKGVNNLFSVYQKSQVIRNQIINEFYHSTPYINLANKLYNFLVKG